MCVALCIVLLDSGEVNGTSRADPTLPHHYTAPGSNYKPVKFVTRPIYSQQQEIMKQSLHLQLLFNNITREKWQFVRVTQHRRKAGSILHHHPERDTPSSPSRLSPPAAELNTNTKQNCAIPIASPGPEGAAALQF